MVKRINISLLFLIISIGIFAQDITKSDFENSEWFTNTNGGKLFKSDTLFLFKTINLLPKKHSEMSSFVKMNYLKTNLISTLEFKKSTVFIDDIDIEWCGFNFSDKINWEFDSTTKRLRFSKKANLIAEYKVVSKKNDFSNWDNNSEENNIELNTEILILELSKLRK